MQTQSETIETPSMLVTESKTTEPAETEEEVRQEPKQSPIYLGAKKFETVEDLAKYTSQLEQQKSQPQYVQPQEPAEKPISELLFENPEKALELHERRVIERIQAEQTRKQQEQAIWDTFYSNNKDLSEDREIVDFVLGKNWENLRHLHPDQAMQKLAEQSRATLAKFRKSPEKNQELPSGQAKVGPNSTRTTPAVAEKKAAPVDFVTQLKKIQSKRK